MNIILAATLEQALLETLVRRPCQQWLVDNRAAIEAYNAQDDRHESIGGLGVFLAPQGVHRFDYQRCGKVNGNTLEVRLPRSAA